MSKSSKTVSPAKTVRENSFGWMTKILCASLDAEMRRELKHLGLSLDQFAMLMTLAEAEGLTQTALGSRISMPGYATTRTIDALEEMRYVERRKDERSRRSYRIYLTDQGRTVIPGLFVIVKKVNGQLLSVLSSDEKKQLMTIYKKIVTARFD